MSENYQKKGPEVDKCLKTLVRLLARSIAKEVFEKHQNINKDDVNNKK